MLKFKYITTKEEPQIKRNQSKLLYINNLKNLMKKKKN